MDEHDTEGLNLTWTLLPGLDLVAMRAFGVVAVFYVVLPLSLNDARDLSFDPSS